MNGSKVIGIDITRQCLRIASDIDLALRLTRSLTPFTTLTTI